MVEKAVPRTNSSAEQQNTKLTLSQAIAEIACHIDSLTMFGDRLVADQAELALNQLNGLTKACWSGMQEHGWRFTAIRSASEPFRLHGKDRTSAHEAVFDLATAFLGRLWFEMDRDSYEATHSDYSGATPEKWLAINTGAGLDPEIIAVNWRRAAEVIDAIVPWRFPEEYSTVHNALKWERANICELLGSGTDSTNWITLQEAAIIAQRDQSVISRTSTYEIRDNGKSGKGRRFDAASVAKWVLSSESRKADRG
jgi:hypothetical protein